MEATNEDLCWVLYWQLKYHNCINGIAISNSNFPKWLKLLAKNQTKQTTHLWFVRLTFLKNSVNAKIVQWIFCVDIHTNSNSYKHEYATWISRIDIHGLQDIGFFYYLFCTTILHITMSAYFLLIVTTKSFPYPTFSKCPRVEHRVPI